MSSVNFKNTIASLENDLRQVLGSEQARSVAEKIEGAILEAVATAAESALPPGVRQLADYVAQKGIAALESATDKELAKLGTVTPTGSPQVLAPSSGAGSMTISQVAPK